MFGNNNNNEEYFKDLFEVWYAPFCVYAKRYIESREEREDIVSSVFLSVWEMLEKGELHKDTAVGYIKISVKNKCLNTVKRKQHDNGYADSLKSRSPVYSEDTVYTLQEMYELLYKTLDKMPEIHRKVFMETCFEGKTQVEIAEEMGISVKSVNRYKQKVMSLLKENMKDFLSVMIFLEILFHDKNV